MSKWRPPDVPALKSSASRILPKCGGNEVSKNFCDDHQIHENHENI